MNQPPQPTRIEYRNATYHGSTLKNLKHGPGLLILDNSDIILTQWNHDFILGPYVYLGSRFRAHGTIRNNKLFGFNVISTNNLITEKSSITTIFANFRQNKLDGTSIILIDGVAYSTQFDNGVGISFNRIHQNDVEKQLTKLFPQNTFELTDYLKQLQTQFILQHSQRDKISKYEPILTATENNGLFYGYKECNRDRRFGFIIRQNEVISIGEHENDLLEGLGRKKLQNNYLEDGVFREGQLKGIGVRYSLKNNKHIFGDFQQNHTIAKGIGWPQQTVSQFRQQFHLRSLYFQSKQASLILHKRMEESMQECISLISSNETQSNYFSSRGDLITTNRNRNLTFTDRHNSFARSDHSQGKIRSKERDGSLGRVRDYEERMNSIDQQRKRNRTWYVKK